VPGFVRRAWGPGWALVGDAGYFKDPITSHGMTDALRDAELLADAVLDGLDGTPEAVALAGYQVRRDDLSRDLFEVTEEVAAYDWDATRLQALLRRVSSAMSDEVEHLQALPPRPGPGLRWSEPA
jgi:flavin-dependent dehydrogenase